MEMNFSLLYRAIFLFVVFSGPIKSYSQGEPFDYLFYQSDDTLSRAFLKEFLVHHDNDLFDLTSANQDDNYTGGFLLRATTNTFSHTKKLFLNFSSDQKEFGPPRTVRNYHTFSVGAVGFTPFNISSSEVLSDDRPYGSFAFAGFGNISDLVTRRARAGSKKRLQKKQKNLWLDKIWLEYVKQRGVVEEDEIKSKRVKKIEKYRKLSSKINKLDNPDFHTRVHKVIRSGWKVGIIGGEAVPTFQSGSHRFLTRETPNGWHNQVGGGKRHLAINYNFHYSELIRKKRFLYRSGPFNKKNFCSFFTPSYFVDANIGSYLTTIGAGLQMNFISINTSEILDDFKNVYSIKKSEASNFIREELLKDEQRGDNLSVFLRVSPALLNRILFEARRSKNVKEGYEEKIINFLLQIADSEELVFTKERKELLKIVLEKYYTDTLPSFEGNTLKKSDFSEGTKKIKRLVDNLNDQISRYPKKNKRTLYGYKLSGLGNSESENITLNVDEKLIQDYKLKVSLYGKIWGRGIVYNSMLQGTLFNDNSVHTVDYRHMNSLVFDAQLGINLQISQSMNIYFFNQFRSQEFLGGKKLHVFGGVGAAKYLGN